MQTVLFHAVSRANPSGLVAQTFKNFAARVGFAWGRTASGRTAVRNGFGISYERNFGNVTYNVIQNTPNYAGVTLTATPASPRLSPGVVSTAATGPELPTPPWMGQSA